MIGIFLALLNPIFVSLQNVLAKKGLIRNDIPDLAVVFARLFYVVPITLIFLLTQGMPTKISSWFPLTMVLLIVLEIPSQCFFHQAIKTEQISFVMPISTLVMIPMLSSFVFFKGWSWMGVVGAVVITFGVYMLQVGKEGISREKFFAPIKSIFTNKASQYMLYTILLWSATTPLQKVAANQANVAFMGVIYLSGCSIGVLIWRLINKKSIMDIIMPPSFGKLIPIGILAGGGSITQYWALSIMNPVYVIALKETILLWSILWDKIIFKHTPTKLQIVSTIIVVIGAIMVGISIA